MRTLPILEPLALASLAATLLVAACASDEKSDRNDSAVASEDSTATNEIVTIDAAANETVTIDAAANETVTDDTSSETTTPSAEPEPAAVLHFGRFDVKVTPPVAATETMGAVAGSATLGGKVQNAAAPELVAWAITLEQAGCELLEPTIPQCEPLCRASKNCSAGDVCVAQAESQSAGTITVSGLSTVSGSTEFTMDPLNPTTNSYSAFGDSKLLFPPFEPGTEVQLAASGGAGQPFILSATGIAPLELLTEGPVPFAEDAPLVLDWVASPESNARIQINVDISHHGGTKGEIICDLEDNGHAEVPGELVTRLIQLGVAGYPTVNVARKTVGRADPGVGDVELVIASISERFLEIPGLISCNGGGCPEGQACGQDLRCQ